MRYMTENATTTGTTRVKRGLADMLKGGVIMDVVTPVSYTHLTLPTTPYV